MVEVQDDGFGSDTDEEEVDFLDAALQREMGVKADLKGDIGPDGEGSDGERGPVSRLCASPFAWCFVFCASPFALRGCAVCFVFCASPCALCFVLCVCCFALCFVFCASTL
jgi:hypothetical protein